MIYATSFSGGEGGARFIRVPDEEGITLTRILNMKIR